MGKKRTRPERMVHGGRTVDLQSYTQVLRLLNSRRGKQLFHF